MKVSQAEVFYEAAENECEQGEYNKAIDNYTKAISLKPGFAEAYLARGIAKTNNIENTDSTIDDFKDIFESAIADFDKAVEHKPKLAAAYYNRGLVKSLLQKHQEAIKDLEIAIELDDSYKDNLFLAKKYFEAGYSAFKNSEYENAIIHLNKAIDLDKKEEKYYYYCGAANSLLKQYQNAIRIFDKLIEINPDYVDVYNCRGFAEYKLGNYSKAIKNVEKSLELAKELHLNKKKQNRIQETIDDLKRKEIQNKKRKISENDEQTDTPKISPSKKKAIEILSKLKKAERQSQSTDYTLKQNYKLAEASSIKESLATLSEDERKKYCCPLTKRIMHEPILTSDGNYYEREAWQEDKTAEQYYFVEFTLKQEITDLLQNKPKLKEAIYISDNLCQMIKQAIDTCNVDLLQKYLQIAPHLINVYDKDKNTWLHYAIKTTQQESIEARLEIVKVLLKSHITVDAYNKEGDQPLHIAAKQGYLTYVQVLVEEYLKQEIAINSPDKAGKTLLQLAAGHSEIVKYLSPSMAYKTGWFKNLDVYYQNPNKKSERLTIPAHQHWEWMHLTNLQQQKTKDKINTEQSKNDTGGNYICCSLTFVYCIKIDNSEKSYHHITINIEDKDTLLHIANIYKGYQNQRELVKVLNRYHPNKIDQIDEIVKRVEQKCKANEENPKKEFNSLFHHSERAFFGYFDDSETDKKLVDMFNKEVKKRHVNIKSNSVTIKTLIVDINSNYYLCNWCEDGLGYFQHPNSEFLENISSHLHQQGYQLPKRKNLPPLGHGKPFMLSRYSASFKSADKPLKEAKDHKSTVFNLKTLKSKNESWILQRDNTEILKNNNTTFFTSRNPKPAVYRVEGLSQEPMSPQDVSPRLNNG